MDNKPDSTVQNTARPVTRRYNKRGKRVGKYAYAAPLGFLISFLAILGVAAIVWLGIAGIRNATDVSDMHDQFYYYLEPLMFYTPEPFEDAAATEQDAFLNAAAFRVMQNEQIRMLREADESCRYPVDDSGRIAVPVEEIENSYEILFGPNATLNHRSTEGSVEYSEADSCYYVPFETPNTGYRAFMISLDRSFSAYTIRVGFVQNADVQLDQYGNEIPPTEKDAAFIHTYTLTRDKENQTFYVRSCEIE